MKIVINYKEGEEVNRLSIGYKIYDWLNEHYFIDDDGKAMKNFSVIVEIIEEI